MSALTPKADISWRQLNVRFVPQADINRRFEMKGVARRLPLGFWLTVLFSRKFELVCFRIT